MEQNKSNKILIPVVILIAFIALIGFVSVSLYGQVIDNETFITGQDVNIARLTGDLNSTAMLYEGKKSELIVANANTAVLGVKVTDLNNIKNNLFTGYADKNIEFNDLNTVYMDINTKYFDLNNIYFDLNNTYVILDINYNDSLSLINDINLAGRDMFIDLSNCYLSVRCVNDRNICMSIYNYSELDLNAHLISWNIACDDITQSDLNSYEQYFE